MFVVRGIPLAFTFVIASGELPDSSDAIQWLKESCWMIISISVESKMFWATESSWGWLNLPSELGDFGWFLIATFHESGWVSNKNHSKCWKVIFGCFYFFDGPPPKDCQGSFSKKLQIGASHGRGIFAAETISPQLLISVPSRHDSVFQSMQHVETK